MRLPRNSGAAGIDRVTLDMVEQYGVSRLVDELIADLKDGRWRPLPARRVCIPKPGTTEQRPLSIPAVRDRVVQAALKIVIEPIFEADFLPCSFGFRPKRAAHDALQVLLDESFRGLRWVVETDIANCFEAIPHEELMQAVEERVCDQGVLKLLRAILRAGVMVDGSVRRAVTGAPQGGVISPLLANVYLHRVDRAWRGSYGTLVRYADDLVVMCRSRGQAEAALTRLRMLLADLGLEPKAAKTRIVGLTEGGEGFDFLGFHHRWVSTRAVHGTHRWMFLARWPSRKAAQHARDRVRDLTARSRLAVPVERVVQDVNLFLRGWAGYFRYGNSARDFDKIMTYADHRMTLFVGKRQKRGRRFGQVMLIRSGNRMGLINLNGAVVAPRPNRAWAGSGRTPPVKDVGEPCAGEPHARFDGRGLETGRDSAAAPVPDPTNLGGHGELLRGSRGDAAGTKSGSTFVERIAVNTGTVSVLALLRVSSALAGAGSTVVDRPIGSRRGGAVVVVGGRESRSQGEGRQRSRAARRLQCRQMRW